MSELLGGYVGRCLRQKVALGLLFHHGF